MPLSDSSPCRGADCTDLVGAGRRSKPQLHRRQPTPMATGIGELRHPQDFKRFTGLEGLGQHRLAHAIRVGITRRPESGKLRILLVIPRQSGRLGTGRMEIPSRRSRCKSRALTAGPGTSYRNLFRGACQRHLRRLPGGLPNCLETGGLVSRWSSPLLLGIGFACHRRCGEHRLRHSSPRIEGCGVRGRERRKEKREG